MRSMRLLVLASALAILAGCSGADADRATGKPSPSGTVSPTPFSSDGVKPSGTPPQRPTAKPNYVVTTCRIEGLSIRLGSFSTNGDETSVNLYIKQVRGPSCTLSGYGSLALFAEDGSEVQTAIVEETSPAPDTIKLQPGREAVKRLRWSTKAAADEPKNGPCGAPAIILSVRLTEPSVAVDLYTKSDRPEGMGPVCNHGRLMHTAWQSA